MNNKSFAYIIFGFFVIVTAIILTLSIKTATIDVEKCLQKDNFKIVGDRIIETLEQKTVIEKKGRVGRGAYVIRFHILDEKTGQKLPITINKAYIDNYDDFNIGDKVLFTRKVYYNLRGLQLNYKDTLTKAD